MADSSKASRLSSYRRLFLRLGIGALCALFFFGYVVFVKNSDRNHALYLSGVLKAASSTEEVIVGSRSYRVEAGNVVALDNKPISEIQRIRALRLAYARILALRAPVLPLDGTNPALLASTTAHLQRIQERLKKEHSLSDSLFPIAFLQSLARTEAARQAFIASGRDLLYVKYAAALEKSLHEGERAAKKFRNAFASSVGPPHHRTSVIGGTLTKEHTLSVLEEIAVAYHQAKQRALAQKRCLDGSPNSCPELSTSTIKIQVMSSRNEDPLRRTLAVLTRTSVVWHPLEQIVALDSSACIGAYGSPAFIKHVPNGPVSPSLYAFVGDIFLRKLTPDAPGPVVSWFQSQGVAHLMYNPLMHYTCPAIGEDIGRVKALVEIAAYTDMPMQPQQVLYEEDVLKVLVSTIEAARRTNNQDKLENLQALAASYHNRSAGLEDIVQNVAFGMQSMLSMHKRGIAVDLQEGSLFATHSGYYALLLGHMLIPTPPHEPDSLNAFGQVFTTFSSMPDSLNTEHLMRDIQTYWDTHK